MNKLKADMLEINMRDETIAAISTAYGEAGIGIVRMSGPQSLEIAKKIINKDLPNRHMVYTKVYDGEKAVDEVLAVYMKAPHSYTGEDVVELQCHGGLLATKEILSLLLRMGAVPAEKGEFTKRAFLNGRMDLSQAEAVIDLIKARSEKSYGSALSQMGGSLFSAVSNIRKKMTDLLVDLTVNMDYPDEDIEQITYEKIENNLSVINDELLKLNASAGEGKIAREGLSVAIVGKPNVGKSSLLNAFLKENRSIVTSVPGTTRDTVEEQAQLRGFTIRFIDTAGIHESEDTVESIGIERSKEALSKADLLLVVLDLSKELEKEDFEILSESENIPRIIIGNKTDCLGGSAASNPDSNPKIAASTSGDELKTASSTSGKELKTAASTSGDELEKLLEKFNSAINTKEKIIPVSIKNQTGIEKIEDSIEKYITGGQVRREEDLVLTNIRHINLVEKALSEIKEALNMAKRQEAIDFIEVNVKAAFDYLGEIIGETATDQIINEVFSRFCLGK